MSKNAIIPSSWQPFSRDRYFKVIRVALSAGKYKFARETVLHWLANYPGDLGAGLLYAKTLMKEGHIERVVQVLQGLCMADPEFLDAVRALARAEKVLLSLQNDLTIDARKNKQGPSITEIIFSYNLANTQIFALGSDIRDTNKVASWGEKIKTARMAIAQGDMGEAEKMIRLGLSDNPPSPLAYVTHLKYLEANEQISLHTKRKIGTEYHQRWPDCLACKLLLAHWLMESGRDEQAVAQLHEVATRDVGYQVGKRIFGKANPYQTIWPDRLELNLDVQIPSEVVALLGWNQLYTGEESYDQKLGVGRPSRVNRTSNNLNSSVAVGTVFAQAVSKPLEAQTSHPEYSSDRGWSPEDKADQSTLVIRSAVYSKVKEELDRLGEEWDVPGVTHWEGRFPVYVVLSVRNNLNARFGRVITADLVMEMDKLVKSIRAVKGWDARLFLADDPEYTQPMGIQPVSSIDPWAIKLALVDLDRALAKQGEMIGALLIVGGPDVVPFHNLPNPVDDQDKEVPSDNPYTTRDENYFFPEWPVGRLPSGSGKDAGLLLDMLRQMTQRYENHIDKDGRSSNWFSRMFKWMGDKLFSRKSGFGYTAAIWKGASESVFSPVGNPKSMFISPPFGINGSSGDSSRLKFGLNRSAKKGVKLPKNRLSYFNLHGLEDSPYWYGQCDPCINENGYEFPIALRPEDIAPKVRGKNNKSPEVVFSEACYGSHIKNKTIDEAISLKFLSTGTQAIVGSTCMSYGSIKPPLIAADLLGFAFWKFLRDGLPAGEALKRAKIHLAKEMHKRQGYLDGEDQKTIISFVFYGDPLIAPFSRAKSSKTIRRPVKTSKVRIICDRCDQPVDKGAIPVGLQSNIERVVAQYLPGMKNADINYSVERSRCDQNDHSCPTNQLKVKASPTSMPQRTLVTLSKNIEYENGYFTHYARLKLNKEGKLVKLVVSR